MADAVLIRCALRRAYKQYGTGNVRVTSRFLKLLADNSPSFSAQDPSKLRLAFVAPLKRTSLYIDVSNVCWVVPSLRFTKTLFLESVSALNQTRKQLGLSSVSFGPCSLSRVAGSQHFSSCLSRAIARYFYMKHYMRLHTEPEQSNLVWEIDRFLSTNDFRKAVAR